ncbi:MAG: N-acetyltransferase [Pirellulales bacterium]
MTATIRDEATDDFVPVAELHQTAFRRDQERWLVDTLREEGWAKLSLVAEIRQDIVGHILFSEVAIVEESRRIAALSLAPVAVEPRWQRQGIGSALIREGLERAARAGHRIVVVLGEPAYYGRFGFSAALAAPLRSKYAGEFFQAKELVPRALAGVSGEVVYPPPFDALG